MNEHQPSTSPTFDLRAKQPLTSVNAVSAAPATSVPYTDTMRLPDRDREIVELVARFKQLSTAQIKSLVFDDAPNNPQRGAIRRLVDNRLLARVNERMAGNVRGGNQMYVYQLGSLGRKLYSKIYRHHTIVLNHHALIIADVYVSLKQAERRGELKLLNWATEPDCHINVGGVDLKPDLYIDIVVGNIRWPIWCEIDLSSEGKRQILEKISDYNSAYESKDQYPLPIYPTVLWLATRDERASELQYWMRYARADPEYVQAVSTVDKLLLSILHT